MGEDNISGRENDITEEQILESMGAFAHPSVLVGQINLFGFGQL